MDDRGNDNATGTGILNCFVFYIQHSPSAKYSTRCSGGFLPDSRKWLYHDNQTHRVWGWHLMRGDPLTAELVQSAGNGGPG
jgi:hypothetical protein